MAGLISWNLLRRMSSIRVLKRFTIVLVIFLLAIVFFITFGSSSDTFSFLFSRINNNPIPRPTVEFNCIVIGSMSFIGSRVATGLTSWNCTNIVPVEYSINIEPDVMRWYRWTQLTTQLNLPTTLIDFNLDDSKLYRLLQMSDNNYIFYIPTGIITQVSSVNDVKLLQVRLNTITNFHKLLNILSTHRDSIKMITLFSFGDEKDSLQSTWLTTLEQSLLSFQHENTMMMNNTVTVLVKGSTNGLYGPWQDSLSSSSSNNTYCWYIDDLVHSVLHYTKTAGNLVIIDDKCQEKHHINKHLTQLWIEQYKSSLKNQTINIASGAILDIKTKYVKWYKSKNFNKKSKYIKEFVMTALKNPDVEVRIFHNNIPQNFISNYESSIERCKFVHYSPINDRVVVDQRFYMLYDYVLHHPEIKSLVNGDLSDVMFTGNPFKVMTLLGDHFYTSLDVPFWSTVNVFPWISKMIRKCYPHYIHMQEVVDLFGVFNSGVMGGSRHVMLTFLAKQLIYLDVANKKGYCDMTSAQIVYHWDFYDQVYAGYPFAGSFLLGTPGPFGSAMKHKYIYRFETRLLH